MFQTAVVFGATGLVGHQLVYELLESRRYSKVTLVLRSDLPIADNRLEKILVEDFAELESQKSRLNANVYFCCIGTTIKKAGTREAFRRVDYDIPKQIAELAQELNVNSLIVISSLGAKATSSNFYLQTKGEMENTVSNIYKGNLKFVRPSLLMGQRAEFRLGEKAGIWFFKLLGFLFIGPLKKYRGIDAVNVARAMIKSVEIDKNRTVLESDELAKMAAGYRKN